jgi:hypothetical protein
MQATELSILLLLALSLPGRRPKRWSVGRFIRIRKSYASEKYDVTGGSLHAPNLCQQVSLPPHLPRVTVRAES